MRVIRRSRFHDLRISALAWIGLVALAGAPAAAAECVSHRGLIETVRACDPTADGAAQELPRSVSVLMPRTASPTLRRGAASPQSQVRSPAHAAIVTDVAARYRIDPGLLSAMIRVESAGKPRAISSKGALGLMQVMPATARSMGVTDPAALLADPALAIETGAAYLKTLQARLGNDVPLIVAAYNAGPGAVLKAGRRVPAYQETQRYVGKVMAAYATNRADALR
jgi:soluble lytic murein transglycosylase-like protein